MATSPRTSPEYVLGRSDIEQKRLVQQAAIVRGYSEQFLRAGGLAPGMRVLDLGCGMGDLSLLAAEIVGESGTVVGIDRDAAVIEKARARGGPVTFQHAEVNAFTGEAPFDAVIGRYVLLYQPDPAATLRHAATLLRPGGLVICHEMDFSQCPSWPEAPLFQRTGQMLAETFLRGNVPANFGMRLVRTFLDAGLNAPEMQAVAPVGQPYLFGWIAETVRSLMPRIEAFGLATVAEIDIDTLAERMEAEALALGSQVMGPVQFGAWTRIA